MIRLQHGWREEESHLGGCWDLGHTPAGVRFLVGRIDVGEVVGGIVGPRGVEVVVPVRGGCGCRGGGPIRIVRVRTAGVVVIRVWCVSIGVEDVLVFEAGVEVGFLVGVEWETDVPIVWDPIFLWAAARVWWQISAWDERCKGRGGAFSTCRSNSWWVWGWPEFEDIDGFRVGWEVPSGASKAAQ